MDLTTWDDLPSEIQRLTMLSMEPQDVANKCISSSKSKAICTQKNFWKDYLKDLNRNGINNAILEIAQHNQSLSRLVYDIAKEMTGITSSTIGTLFYFSIMREDFEKIAFFKNEYINRMIQVDYDFSRQDNNIVVSNSKKIVDILNRKVKNEYSDWKKFYRSIYFEVAELFVISFLLDKVDTNKMLEIIPDINGTSSYSINFIKDILKSYCYYQEINKLQSLLPLLMDFPRDYVYTIADYLSVKLYPQIEPYLGEGITLIDRIRCPLDKEHLTAIASLPLDEIKIFCELYRYFTPIEFVTTVINLNTNREIKEYLVNEYISTVNSTDGHTVEFLWEEYIDEK